MSHWKHLQNNRKNKKTTSNEFELREIDKSHAISTSHPVSCRPTANSCYSLAERQLPQLPDTSHNQTDPPFYNLVQKAVQIKCLNLQHLQIKESPKMKIPATTETVKNILEDAGLYFCKYYKVKHTKKKDH